MRLIYDHDEDEDYLELIMDEDELDRLKQHEPLTQEFYYGEGVRCLNIYVRKFNYLTKQN